MYKPNLLRIPAIPPKQELRFDGTDLDLQGGLNLEYTESQIRDNQCSAIKNLWSNNRGTLSKMPGLDRAYTTSLGKGEVKGGHLCFGKRIFCFNNKLYSQIGTNQPVELLSGLTTTYPMQFAELNNVVYGVNGTDFVQYDGTTASFVTDFEVPVIIISRFPNVKNDVDEPTVNGGGFSYKPFNTMTPKFKIRFIADNVNNTYYAPGSVLPLDNVQPVLKTYDVALQLVTNGITITSFNKDTGAVVLSGNIPSEYTVELQFEKTVEGYANRVKKCKFITAFGSASDNRLFVNGNVDNKQFTYYSELNDATYFPDTYSLVAGGTEQVTTSFGKIYTSLLVFKEKQTYIVEYNETVGYTIKLFNDSIGCDCPYTITSINNMPIFLNTYNGVCTVANTNVKDEKNILPISQNVNGNVWGGANDRPGILYVSKSDGNQLQWQEKMKKACAVDWYGKYWLNIDDKTYVWDYILRPFDGFNAEMLVWLYRTSINATCFIVDSGRLFYGDRLSGYINRFVDVFAEFTTDPVKALYKSKLFDFKLPDWYKTIRSIWFNITNTNSNLVIRFLDQNLNTVKEINQTIAIVSEGTFNWKNFDWSTFTFKGRNSNPISFQMFLNINRVVYFQFEIENINISADLEIINAIIEYQPNYKVKQLI